MTVNYKGKKITKTEKGWMTGGFLTYFNTLQEAKEAINAAIVAFLAGIFVLWFTAFFMSSLKKLK